MRNLERRLATLEANAGPSGDYSLALDGLTDGDLERLEELIVDRDAGRWSEVEELGEDGLRLLARIRILPCAA